MLMQSASVVPHGFPMPRLLVSVRNATEAQIAVDEGVQLVDVKEPRSGSLGAAPAESIRQVADICCGQTILLSVALGELLETPQVYLPENVLPAFVKCGLSGCGQRPHWSDLWQKRMERHAELAVAVVYADWKTANAPSSTAVVKHAVEVGCRTVLLDTFDKSKGSLLQHMTLEEIYRWIATVRKRGMKAVVAGSLTQSLIVPLLAGGADCVALRGAACRGSRSGSLDRDKLRQLVQEADSVHVSGTDSVTV